MRLSVSVLALFALLLILPGVSVWCQESDDNSHKEYIDLRLKIIYLSTEHVRDEEIEQVDDESPLPSAPDKLERIHALALELLELNPDDPDPFGNAFLVNSTAGMGDEHLEQLIPNYRNLLESGRDNKAKAVGAYCLALSEMKKFGKIKDQQSETAKAQLQKVFSYLRKAVELEPRMFRPRWDLYRLSVATGDYEGDQILREAEPVLKLIRKPNPAIPDVTGQSVVISFLASLCLRDNITCSAWFGRSWNISDDTIGQEPSYQAADSSLRFWFWRVHSPFIHARHPYSF